MDNSTMEKILAKYLAKPISQKNAEIDTKAETDMVAVQDVTAKIRKLTAGYAKEPATDSGDDKAKVMGYEITPRSLWRRIKGEEMEG
jgi:hypothetical protein